VPQMIEALRRVPGFDASRLRKLTALVSGGAPHNQADIDAWLEENVALVLGFGMTEGGTIFGMPPELATIRAKPGSVGVPGPSMRTRVVDAEGADCRPGEIGELWLSGDSVTPGYWQNPTETAAAFKDGWFRSGDLVRQDEDGYFWIVGRLKDMFISGGENVYPSEVELALVGYPGLREYAVIGVPDPTWGEVGRLVVALEAAAEFDPAEVLAHLRARLAAYKVPKAVTVLDTLPRTPTGKIQPQRLREMCGG
jgi:fatty-acyl-CoA synthase